MPKRTGLAIGSLLALTVAAAGALVAPPALAAGPFSNAYWDADRGVNVAGCSVSYDKPAPAVSDIPTDSAAHALDQAYVATVTTGANPADITTINYSQHAVGTVGAVGTNPSKLWLNYSGKATLARQTTPSQCVPNGTISTHLRFSFSLTQSMWVNVSLSSRGGSYGELYIYDVNSNPYLDMYTYGLKFDTTGRALLPPGDYSGYLEGETTFGDASLGGTLTGSGFARATFTVPGSKSAGPSGTAKSYVGLGSARSCATHTLATKVTTNKKRAKTIKKIVFTVNGHKVKTVRSHLRGKTIPLNLTDTKAANVKATVTTVTVKKKHHHKQKIHKTRTVTASYLACS